MKKLLYLLPLVFLAIAGACAIWMPLPGSRLNPEAARIIEPGMSQVQVEAILGPPNMEKPPAWVKPAPHVFYSTMQHWRGPNWWIMVAYDDTGKVAVADCWTEPSWFDLARGWADRHGVGW
jgi:hypothetical protein